MDHEERERYSEAIKRAAISKGFDRVLNILVVFVFLFVAGYVIYQQATYQNDVRKVTESRNEQLNEIQMSQESVEKASEELKDYIACLKKLPVSPPDDAIHACREPQID